MDELIYAIKIHSKTDEEIDKEIIELYEYFINLGVDLNKLLEFQSLSTERTIRSLNKGV